MISGRVHGIGPSARVFEMHSELNSQNTFVLHVGSTCGIALPARACDEAAMAAYRELFTDSMLRWLIVYAVALAACGDNSAKPDAPTSPASSAAAAGPPQCTLPSTCSDFQIVGMMMKACCSPTVVCGYELPRFDEEMLRDFAETEGMIVQLTGGDPNRCAPESFFFGPNPELPELRIEVERGDDILLTPDCTSYRVLAWGLPGCCLPNDTCGLSTDESYSTFANIIQGDGVPFDHPECLSAEALNQNFRNSGVLAAFARTVSSGTCNYAALDSRLK